MEGALQGNVLPGLNPVPLTIQPGLGSASVMPVQLPIQTGLGAVAAPIPLGGIGPTTAEIPPEDHTQHDDSETDRSDIYKLTPHVTISFDDTFKESSAIKGFSFMEKVNGAIYKWTHFAFYATFTLLIGPFLAWSWATSFAMLHITIIWFVQPWIKAYYICLRLFNLLYEPMLRLLCDPFFRSVSLIYSGIRGQLKLKGSDFAVNVKTTQV